MIRPGVSLIADAATGWPSPILDMKPGDVLVVFDIRRYEQPVQALVDMAAERGAVVVLFTDQWMSPAAARASHVFAAHIEAPSAWDSNSVLMVLVETLLAAVQALTRNETRIRMAQLEELYERSRALRRR